MKKAEYLRLLSPIVDDYRNRGYSFWLPYLSGTPIVFEFDTADGTKLCVEI